MNTPVTSSPRVRRVLFVVLGLTLLASAVGPLPGALAAEPSEEPAAVMPPEPTTTPAQALCESAADLRLIIGFLRETSISEDGLVPVVVGVIAGISEARQLASLVGETYRPLADDLIASLQGLQATLDELGDEATVGARIASIGEAVTEIGNAMDALTVALRDPCLVETPDASEAPTG